MVLEEEFFGRSGEGQPPDRKRLHALGVGVILKKSG